MSLRLGPSTDGAPASSRVGVGFYDDGRSTWRLYMESSKVGCRACKKQEQHTLWDTDKLGLMGVHSEPAWDEALPRSGQ